MTAAVNYAAGLAAKGATLTLADATRTAPANAGTVFTWATAGAYAGGGLCERLTITPLATTTATVLRFWLYDGAGNYHLFLEVPILPQTVTLAAAVISQVLSAVDYPQVFPKVVPVGWSIVASLNDAQTGVKVIGEGGGS